MKSEIFIDCGSRLKKKSNRIYRKSLQSITKAKNNLIECIITTNHYCSEISIQAKVFKNNLNHINRFRTPTNYDN